MSNSTLENLSFDEFLVIVNGRDVDGSYVVPKPDVNTRLTREIEQRTGIKSRNMTGEGGIETFQRWVMAQPDQFIIQTRIAVDAVSTVLVRERAKSFEVTFHNIQDGLNWGDRILLAVRYDRAA